MMSLRASKTLWLIVAAGLAIRVVLAFAFTGTNHVDIEATASLRVRGWDWHAVYEAFPPWTYPPLFLPWLAGASWLSEVSGLSFHGLAKLGPTLADVGLALAVYAYLGWRQARERIRLIGAALVMLGPSFIAVSGYHGQIDSVAILPPVLALMLWERGPPTSTRALGAGLLIGLGAAIKLVPLLVVLPLLGSARSWKQAAMLAGAALAVPALVLAPLWISGIDLNRVVRYTGVAGWGGLSLVVHPGLGWHWLAQGASLETAGGGVTRALQDASRWITIFALVGYTAFILRYRPAPVDAAVLLWLAIYVFSPNFFLNYLIWGLPFFIMAGYLVQVAVLQAALMAPTVAYYLTLWPSPSTVNAAIYVPILIVLWLFWGFVTFVLVQRIIRRQEVHRSGIQPPLVTLATAQR